MLEPLHLWLTLLPFYSGIMHHACPSTNSSQAPMDEEGVGWGMGVVLPAYFSRLTSPPPARASTLMVNPYLSIFGLCTMPVPLHIPVRLQCSFLCPILLKVFPPGRLSLAPLALGTLFTNWIGGIQLYMGNPGEVSHLRGRLGLTLLLCGQNRDPH